MIGGVNAIPVSEHEYEAFKARGLRVIPPNFVLFTVGEDGEWYGIPEDDEDD